jgi:hypothetical protein
MLPAPYDTRNPEDLIADLADPDRVSDDVLDWLIDMPEAGSECRPRFAERSRIAPRGGRPAVSPSVVGTIAAIALCMTGWPRAGPTPAGCARSWSPRCHFAGQDKPEVVSGR